MKKKLLTVLTLLSMAFVTACAPNDTEPVVEEEVSEETVSDESGKETKYPLTIEDASGRKITVEEEPEKIVSTSPSETEILFALGLDDKIVGVSDYADYPEAALDKDKVGGVVDPNAEAIIDLEADIVISGISMSEDVVDKLANLDLTIYKNDGQSLDEILNNILKIGKLVNAQAEAEELVADMQADIDEVKEAVKDVPEEEKQKVYLEFTPGWTVGSGEFLDELIQVAGGINVASELDGWAEVNEEKIIEEDPDVILYAKDAVDFETEEPLEDLIRERSGWENISAIENDRVIGIDENTVSRIGPRVTDALKKFAEAIYPELYSE
ncbi:MAG: ABC transporter substrate-binding protein [Atopostipes suicloacalis]|nr:ABC transporter substrate-binding protein [Atopostipes suicloacalis]